LSVELANASPRRLQTGIAALPHFKNTSKYILQKVFDRDLPNFQNLQNPDAAETVKKR
jgi:hypothetical protein